MSRFHFTLNTGDVVLASPSVVSTFQKIRFERFKIDCLSFQFECFNLTLTSYDGECFVESDTQGEALFTLYWKALFTLYLKKYDSCFAVAVPQ